MRADWTAAIGKLMDARADLGRAWLKDTDELKTANRAQVAVILKRCEAYTALDSAVDEFREALGLEAAPTVPAGEPLVRSDEVLDLAITEAVSALHTYYDEDGTPYEEAQELAAALDTLLRALSVKVPEYAEEDSAADDR